MKPQKPTVLKLKTTPVKLRSSKSLVLGFSSAPPKVILASLKPDDYLHRADGSSRQGQVYAWKGYRGYLSIMVLPELTGKKWDSIALGYAHALRPTQLRVIRHNEGTQLDAETWRVTVYLDEKNKIKYISQEVEVGLPDGVTCGSGLRTALTYGPHSPQAKWEALDGMLCCGMGGTFKCVGNKQVWWPESRKKRRDRIRKDFRRHKVRSNLWQQPIVKPPTP